MAETRQITQKRRTHRTQKQWRHTTPIDKYYPFYQLFQFRMARVYQLYRTLDLELTVDHPIEAQFFDASGSKIEIYP